MTITVGGTTITFNDGTTQSTAAVSTSTTFGAVGTYFYAAGGGGTLALGGTVAGSTLTWYNNLNNLVSAGLSGTWRMMGSQANDQTARRIFVRIS